MTVWLQMTLGYKNTQCLGHNRLVADDLWLQEHSTSRL